MMRIFGRREWLREVFRGNSIWSHCCFKLRIRFVRETEKGQFCCTLEITSFNRGVAHLVESLPYVPKKMSIDHGFYHLLDSPGKCVISFFM